MSFWTSSGLLATLRKDEFILIFFIRLDKEMTKCTKNPFFFLRVIMCVGH